jgi:hypothetical protein
MDGQAFAPKYEPFFRSAWFRFCRSSLSSRRPPGGHKWLPPGLRCKAKDAPSPLQWFLEGFRIRDYKISGIGPAKLAALTSYGIETAADVSPERVQSVPGFGRINSVPLIAWRDQHLKRFVYDPNPNALDRIEIAKIKTDTAKRRDGLRKSITESAQKYIQAAGACKAMIERPDPLLESLHLRRTQLEADLVHLKIPIPARPFRQPQQRTRTTARPVTAYVPARPSPAQASSGSPLCPRCHSPMIKRFARRGRNSGKPFWGCVRFPRCRATRPI